MSRALLILFLLIIITGCATSGSKKPLVVVLSFDYEDLSLPGGGENLEAILAMLERRNISSTFFILGATAERYPGDVRKIYAGGHSLGLHTYYHNFPIFSREDAELIGGIYDKSAEAEWSSSFKTPEAFKADLEENRKAIQRALGFDARIEMFRAPSMVVNWVSSEAYYDILGKEGITLESSTYQDFGNPRAYYVEKGVIVVPIAAFESRLENDRNARGLADKSAKAGVPFHLVAHPQKLDSRELRELENFLSALEERYEVTYLRVEEVPGYYAPR